MLYEVEVNAPRVNVTVTVDPHRWPAKTAGHMARESLSSLAKGIAVAIENAAHVGVAREMVSVSPVQELGAPLRAEEAPKPVAPRVGEKRTLEELRAAAEAAILPPKVRLASEGDLIVRSGPGGGALLLLQEARPEGWPRPLDSLSVAIPYSFEFEDIRKHITQVALKLSRRIEERELQDPVILDGPQQPEEPQDEGEVDAQPIHGEGVPDESEPRE